MGKDFGRAIFSGDYLGMLCRNTRQDRNIEEKALYITVLVIKNFFRKVAMYLTKRACSNILQASVVFLFIVASLTIHEIGEYLIDQFWDFKLQGVYIRDVSGLEKLNLVQSKNDDTMTDIILGTIASLLFIAVKGISSFYKNKLK